MNPPDVLTVTEAAGLLRCSRAKVFRLIAEGVLQRAASYGRHTLVLAESVTAAISATPKAPKPAVKRIRPRKTFQAELDAVFADAKAGRL